MSATQTAEPTAAKQAPAPATSSSTTNGARRTRTRGPNKHATPKPAARTDAAAAPIQAAKVQPAKTPVAQPARARAAEAQPPVIQSLVQMLPEAGTPWSQQDAVSWMEAIAASLRLVYQLSGAITVTGTPAARVSLQAAG
jgi:hypothetical protein